MASAMHPSGYQCACMSTIPTTPLFLFAIGDGLTALPKQLQQVVRLHRKTGHCIPNALETAFASAAPAAVIPPSPAPFTPRGFSGVGKSSVDRNWTRGTSIAVGIK